MRETSSLLPLAASSIAAFVLAAAVFISPDLAVAGKAGPTLSTSEGRSTCDCPETSNRSKRPKFAELKPYSDGRPLDADDQMAALSSVQHALANVADGSTFVWHRQNGRLSGLVKPTSSFKNADGAICRHIVVLMTTGARTKKTEGIACRLENGVWSLEG
jgi:hypothetical protein